MAVTVIEPTFTYDTTLTLAMSAPSVLPGDALTATATLLGAQAGTPPVVGAEIDLVITPEVGSDIKMTGITNASGVAVFDLTATIASATPTVGGYGAWKFFASFAGVTQ